MARHYIIPEYRHLITGNLCSIFNVNQDGLYITDRHGTTIGLNSSYEKLTGLNREELLGRNINDLVKDGTFDAVLNPEVVATRKVATRVQVNKENRKVLVTAYPIFDYDDDVDLVVTIARDVTLMSQLQEQMSFQKELIDRYRENVDTGSSIHGAIFNSIEMTKLLDVLERVAKTEATVLLLGETGVGKDVVARKVHEMSPRAVKPFFKVDCTSIPENLIESELFGYAPGAFSGASPKGKLGFFEIADHGTLFLDEIGELPLQMQGRLLRVLQDGEICRVGDTKTRKVDVRIIAATNRNLEQEVLDNKFRSDLFYRLRVAVSHIPALRARQTEIIPLAQHFLDRYSHKYRKTIRYSAQTEEVFLNYGWPGNVRELENLVHSLVVTCVGGIIALDDLPLNFHKSITGRRKRLQGQNTEVVQKGLEWNDFFEGKSLKDITEQVERKALSLGMREHDSISSLAKTLKTERSTLSRKLKKYGIKAKP